MLYINFEKYTLSEWKILCVGILEVVAFQVKQPGFGPDPASAAIAAQAAIRADQAVARDDHRERVGGVGRSDRPGGARPAKLAGNLAVAGGLPVGDLLHGLVDRPLEWAEIALIDCQGEGAPRTGQVFERLDQGWMRFGHGSNLSVRPALMDGFNKICFADPEVEQEQTFRPGGSPQRAERGGQSGIGTDLN